MSDSRYSLHAFADDLTAVIARLASGRNRFFARSVESPPLPDVIRATDVHAPAFGGEGVYEAEAETAAGALDPAFRVARWLGPDRPTLVYLQGSGERPFDDSGSKNSFKTIVLDGSPGWEANLMVVRAPFHAGSQREYARSMGELVHFTSMIAAMVVLTEHLVESLAARGGRTVITGISLGGWATNLHAALFGSAAAYIPLLAGTALDDLFLRSSYRWMTATAARERPDRLHQVLNFEEAFRAAPAGRVHPLLGKHDRFIRLVAQAPSYGDIPVHTLDRGHITSVASPALIREHIRRFMAVDPDPRAEAAG